jgi:hypothetical protein
MSLLKLYLVVSLVRPSTLCTVKVIMNDRLVLRCR